VLRVTASVELTIGGVENEVGEPIQTKYDCNAKHKEFMTYLLDTISRRTAISRRAVAVVIVGLREESVRPGSRTRRTWRRRSAMDSSRLRSIANWTERCCQITGLLLVRSMLMYRQCEGGENRGISALVCPKAFRFGAASKPRFFRA